MKDPRKHPTRRTSGISPIRITSDTSKYNELIDYCIKNYIKHSIYKDTVWVRLSKFNEIDINWRWLMNYKHSLNNYA